MSKIELYHGSEKIIEQPLFNVGKPNNDYGQGFYTTRHLELAKEWAVDDKRNGFVNAYEFDTKGLKVLDLNGEDFSILHWLTVLLEHRNFKVNSPVAQDGLEFLIRNYHVDIDNYDLIIGYRADDSYFSFARAFIANSISIAQLEKAMYLGELGLQYFIKSEKAFSKLKFKDVYSVEYTEYYPKKLSRDTIARDSFSEISRTMDRDGTYLLDLIREEK